MKTQFLSQKISISWKGNEVVCEQYALCVWEQLSVRENEK